MRGYELELLTEMLHQYSPSGEEAALGEHLKKELEKNGFEVRFDGAGNVIGTRGKGSPTLLLAGHMDTVPGKLAVRVEGDNLYGRGAVDAKAPLASMIIGASRVQEPKGSMIIACLVDEEGSGKGIRQLIKDALQVDYAIFGEPSHSWNVTIGYKGGIHLMLECTTSAAHSSAPWLSDNAIEKTYEYWELIKKVKFKGEKPESRFYSVTSCLTRLNGGGSSSMIPSRCEAEIDMRIPPQISSDAILQELQKILGELNKLSPKTELKVKSLGTVTAYEADPHSLLVRALTYSIRKTCQKTPTLLKKTGTGDMNELGSTMKIPMVSYGPGDSHLDHTTDEHVSISEYLSSIKVYEEAIPRLFDLHNLQTSR
jgi:LysW-gamma-L-lysine carboxypeptidase